MDVIILCGGKGSRLGEETELKPKPMVEIGGKPILWHIMKYYSFYGYNRFILPLGYKGSMIMDYFKSKSSTFFKTSEFVNWEIILEDTGINTLKGARIKRIEKHVRSENFHLTYGDGLSNVNLEKLLSFHKSHERIGTLTAVHPPSRFGEITILKNQVTSFEEKAQMGQGYINGGFFIFHKNIFDYLEVGENFDFEFEAIQKLVQKKNLMAYKHESFWQCMDNIREKKYLNNLVKTSTAPWIKW